MMAAPRKPTPAVILHAARASNNRYAQVPTASGLTALAARGLCAKLFVGLRSILTFGGRAYVYFAEMRSSPWKILIRARNSKEFV
jgi:hypothetical protein